MKLKDTDENGFLFDIEEGNNSISNSLNTNLNNISISSS